MPKIEPVIVSSSVLKKLLLKAYANTESVPKYYPNVDTIDEWLYGSDYQTQEMRENTLKVIFSYLCYGFRFDRRWHEIYPEYAEPTANNIIRYLFTPLTGEDALNMHVGIWTNRHSDEEIEDRQAAFEYMQSIITDPTIMTLDKEMDECLKTKY